jgi:hypothetical protein
MNYTAADIESRILYQFLANTQVMTLDTLYYSKQPRVGETPCMAPRCQMHSHVRLKFTSADYGLLFPGF